ncbi:interaptin-like isoform X2 [Stegodyphus dumicola]|uniref:interaptin-like isoform X2 n=1 Tax=Stegodyphus dumicola TaxID=202533 RepID=UPI0015B1D69A|nr:interaptin-like isoform X2 [Stegodyphus dumicola]
MDNERQKKIEAGKLKLAEFKKKRLKNEKAKKLSENPVSSTAQENCSGNLKEKQTIEESTSMNNCTMKEYSSYDSNRDNAVDKSSAQEGVLQLSDESDDSVPFPEEAELVSLYDQKIKKYQEAICQRDAIIQQLSRRLESAMNMNQAKESAGNQEVQNLKEEINMLHLQMKEAAELLEKQKSKNEMQANIQNVEDLSSSSCISKFELGVQVDAKEISSLQSFDFKNTSLFNDILSSDSTSDDSSFFVIQKVSECLQDKISHVQLQELVKLIKERLDLFEAPHHAKSNNDNDLVTDGQGKGFNSSNEAMSTLLKRIISLNIVAKLIESLISIAPVSTNASATDFSPSKFQSFFLKRLNSSETDDLIPNISENESVPSDINYAEVETPCRIPFSGNQSIKSSIEKLRNKDISEDINLVTEFLADEMEKISESVSVFKLGAQGDSMLQCKEGEVSGLQEVVGTSEVKTGHERDYESILRQKAKLQIRIKNLKQLDKELIEEEQNVYQRSVESDTLVNSEDNLLMDEPPLSCVSLLSLTDSECKTEYVTTDSETNFSRKVSFDMTKPAQEQEICVKCEKYLELVKEKYEDEICILKETLENNHSLQKMELLESIKELKSEIEKLKSDKDDLNVQLNQQIELLCKEHELKIQYLTEEHNKALTQLQNSCSKFVLEKDELVVKVKDLENKLNIANEKTIEALNEKAKIECSLPIQIADLVQEHQQDLEALKTLSTEQLNQEKKKLEMEHLASIEMLRKLHDDEIEDLRSQIQKEFQEKEQKLINEHSKAIGLIEAAHSDESATYQKKIEQLLEEKCELLSKTTHEYETILKKNHKALIILCNQLRAKVSIHKQRMLNSSLKSSNSDKDFSEFDIFDDLNNSLESGLVKFLNQNYFMSNANKRSNDADYLEERSSLSDLEDKANDPKTSNMTDEQNLDQMGGGEQMFNRAVSEVSIDSDDMQMIYSEINKLQEEFQKDVAMYRDVNEQLHQECKTLRKQINELEHHKEDLEMQLHSKEKELVDKESQLASMDAAAVKHAADQFSLTSCAIRPSQNISRY